MAHQTTLLKTMAPRVHPARRSSPLRRLVSKAFVIGVPYGWHILFFLVPFCMVFKLSFSESVLGRPPYTDLVQWMDGSFLQLRLNLGNYRFLIDDPLYLNSYLQSLYNASVATAGCLLLGYPLAYGITLATGYWRTLCLMLVILPFWTSFLIRVYAWIGILSNTGLVNSLLLKCGLIYEPIPILDTEVAVIIGLVYSYLPFMVLPLYASLEKIDFKLIEAAYDLGCKPVKAFFKVIMPLSYRGIVSGSMLVFIPSVGEFVIPTLLGGSNSNMIGRILWNEFFTNNDWPLAAALVMALFFVLVIPIILFQRMLSTEQHEAEGGDTYDA